MLTRVPAYSLVGIQSHAISRYLTWRPSNSNEYMSMNITDINRSARPNAAHHDCADHEKFVFANSVQARRQELGLSLFEAAELSGLTVYQWAAIEEGCWIPESRNVLRSMAGALQASALQTILLANASSWAQCGAHKHTP